MRFGLMFVTLTLAAAPVMAAPQERARVIRAGDLMAQPFIDAAKIAPVAADQPVIIVERRGGWVNVQANGKSGWLRTLNLRLEPGTSDVNRSLSRSASLFRTGSSGQTVTTGVKGLDEEKLRNATVDPAQLAKLGTLAIPEGEARAVAARKKLVETKLDYLKPGKKNDEGKERKTKGKGKGQ